MRRVKRSSVDLRDGKNVFEVLARKLRQVSLALFAPTFVGGAVASVGSLCAATTAAAVALSSSLARLFSVPSPMFSLKPKMLRNVNPFF